MKKTIATTLIAVMALTGLTGCGTSAKAEGTPAIKVNTAVVTVEAIDSRFEQTCAMYGLDATDPNLAFLKESVWEGLIDEKLLLVEADKRGIKAKKDEIKALEDQVIAQYPSQEDFEKSLAEKSKMTMTEFSEMAKEQVLFEGLIADETKDVVVDPEAYYNANPESFRTEEQVKASHILVATEAEAKDIIALLNGGADFAQMAKDKSTDTASGAQGGELGYFTKADMVAEFSAVAFAQEIGTVSQAPVQSQFGYHIIKVEDKKAAGNRTYEEVKEALNEQLITEEQNVKYTALLEKLRAEATIEYVIDLKSTLTPAPVAEDPAAPAAPGAEPAAPADTPTAQ